MKRIWTNLDTMKRMMLGTRKIKMCELTNEDINAIEKEDMERKKGLEFCQTLLMVGKQEGDKFRAKHNREPTEAEAEKIADAIIQLAKNSFCYS